MIASILLKASSVLNLKQGYVILMINNKMIIKKSVAAAISEKRPVVALESTIISHGMPWPANLDTARLLEETVESNGATAATIAIIDGIIRIGLENDELEMLAQSKNVKKASRRDLPSLLTPGQHAATTVSATMICAHLAGIQFFATGGIGGVHRGASNTMDISADLHEFVHTPVLVVSAGAKAILDIGLTLEYLETLGVPVVGYKTDEFPAFYYKNSGFASPSRAENPVQIAEMFLNSKTLGYRSGMLVGNPVPEDEAMSKDEIESCIDQALKEAAEKSITGQQVTPFLLSRLERITQGKSLKTNVALVENNARLCAQIAVGYARLAE